jgi:hypothetical protein
MAGAIPAICISGEPMTKHRVHAPHAATHRAIANRHLALNVHHIAIGAFHKAKGDTEIGQLHQNVAAHHLGLAKLYGGLAGDTPVVTPAQALAGGTQADPLPPPDGTLPGGAPLGNPKPDEE